ncbi:MAG: hypothetical protein ACFFG0_37340 [Candidatus Thorarchaeota archaeon]
MEKYVKLARKLEAKYRRLRRFVESTTFQYAWKNEKEKDKILSLIEKCEISELKDWAYNNNPLVDAPLRWLRKQASKYNIPNYSRKTKVQLVDDITRIAKQSAK